MKLETFASSANPEKAGLTISGLGLTGLVITVGYILKIFGLDVGANDITSILNTVLLIVSGVMTLWGLVRKVFFAVLPKP